MHVAYVIPSMLDSTDIPKLFRHSTFEVIKFNSDGIAIKSSIINVFDSAVSVS